jgi:hypothetical protein
LVAAAAHLARPRPEATEREGRSRLGWRLLALPLACNLASLVVLAIGWGDDMPLVAAWLAIGCVLAAMAHHLGISLVAEGVEDEATAVVLKDLGCDVAQGYAIARPMPVPAFLDWPAAERAPLVSR